MTLFRGILERLRSLLGRPPDLFNLHVEPTYAIKASRSNPYFQALEAKAREAGFLGDFVVDAEGRLRPGSAEGIAARKATLALDVYPNPAAIEGRTVASYDDPDAPRRGPRATLVLDDGSEVFLQRDGTVLRAAGDALDEARRRLPSR